MTNGEELAEVEGGGMQPELKFSPKHLSRGDLIALKAMIEGLSDDSCANFEIDIEKLISTRMLIQGNSGSGKTETIKRIIADAQKFKRLIIDTEGDFSELVDYGFMDCKYQVSAWEEGEDTAKEILKSKDSPIIDLTDLGLEERQLFVRDLLNTFLLASKSKWQKMLIVIDEAHTFAPRSLKENESARAVADIAAKGRKRGFGLVISTQRLSKLNKDVAAECLNKMIGRTTLDLDVRRSAMEIGMVANAKSLKRMRTLAPGEFYSFGPAISDDVTKVYVQRIKDLYEIH